MSLVLALVLVLPMVCTATRTPACSMPTPQRVGYLGLMILLDERQEVLMLVTNSLKNDLNSRNQYTVGLALCALGNICSAEMARDLAPEVERLLLSANPYLRKKAALCASRWASGGRGARSAPDVATTTWARRSGRSFGCSWAVNSLHPALCCFAGCRQDHPCLPGLALACRVLRKVPDMLESIMEKAPSLLEDRSHSVLLAGVQLMLDICTQLPAAVEAYRVHVPLLCKILRSLLMGGFVPGECSCEACRQTTDRCGAQSWLAALLTMCLSRRCVDADHAAQLYPCRDFLAASLADYDVGGINDPFLQVAILRLLRLLGRGSAEASDAMNDVLAQVGGGARGHSCGFRGPHSRCEQLSINTHCASRWPVPVQPPNCSQVATNIDSSRNAGNAILYECVQVTGLARAAEPHRRACLSCQNGNRRVCFEISCACRYATPTATCLRPDHHGHRVHRRPARAGSQHSGPLPGQQGQQHPLRGAQYAGARGGGGCPGGAAASRYRGGVR